MSISPRLETIAPANVEDACRLRVRPEQERFVTPVAESTSGGQIVGVRLLADR